MGRQGVQRYRLRPLEIFKVLQGGPLSWKRKCLEWTDLMGGVPILIDKIKSLKQQMGSRNA